MTRSEKALELKANGYNCAQAVACAFADKTDFDEKTLCRLATGFGAGGGNMQGTCGALSGAYLLTSIILGNAYKGDPMAKGKIMAANREIAKQFYEKNSSIICKNLKGLESGKVLRSCDGCVEDAAAILERYLEMIGL